MQLQAGRKGRNGWASELETELSHLGLRVHEVAADGSCFFRSLADQLKGRSGDHRQLRKSIVHHIEANRDLYEPFIEDDEPFDKYLKNMAQEGTWAGNLELQAASIQLKVNLRIYQAGQPPWVVQNYPAEEVPMLHISYHNGIHYNSVRLVDDYGTGPPEPIPIYSFAGTNGTSGKSTSGISNYRYSESDLRRVKDGTGCEDDTLVVAALEKLGGNVDAAIEALVEKLHGEENGGDGGGNGDGGDGLGEEKQDSDRIENKFKVLSEEKVDERDCILPEKLVEIELEVSRGGKGKCVKLRLNIVYGEEKEENHNVEEDKEEINEDLEEHIGDRDSTTTKKKKIATKRKKESSQPQLPARNSRCPCGSTKKYKNCCGASKSARERTENNGEDNTSVAQIGATMQTSLYI
jgi:OTU-like cysteine protease/SEC-C motif